MGASGPNSGLPPVWSPCQWVFKMNLSLPSPSSFNAVRILSASGANWSSTIKIPSSPTETPIFPPAPSSMYTFPATWVLFISTSLKSRWLYPLAINSPRKATTMPGFTFCIFMTVFLSVLMVLVNYVASWHPVWRGIRCLPASWETSWSPPGGILPETAGERFVPYRVNPTSWGRIHRRVCGNGF